MNRAGEVGDSRYRTSPTSRSSNLVKQRFSVPSQYPQEDWPKNPNWVSSYPQPGLFLAPKHCFQPQIGGVVGNFYFGVGPGANSPMTARDFACMSCQHHTKNNRSFRPIMHSKAFSWLADVLPYALPSCETRQRYNQRLWLNMSKPV